MYTDVEFIFLIVQESQSKNELIFNYYHIEIIDGILVYICGK